MSGNDACCDKSIQAGVADQVAKDVPATAGEDTLQFPTLLWFGPGFLAGQDGRPIRASKLDADIGHLVFLNALVERCMLLPHFSVRTLLLVTAVSGVYFAAIVRAVEGDVWALTLVVVTTGLALTFVFYAMLFWVAWVVSRLVSLFQLAWRGGETVEGNPFAAHRLPPQEVNPEEGW